MKTRFARCDHGALLEEDCDDCRAPTKPVAEPVATLPACLCGLDTNPVASPRMDIHCPRHDAPSGEAELWRVKKVPMTSTWSCPNCNHQNVYREGVVSDPQNKCAVCGREVIVGEIRNTDTRVSHKVNTTEDPSETITK